MAALSQQNEMLQLRVQQQQQLLEADRDEAAQVTTHARVAVDTLADHAAALVARERPRLDRRDPPGGPRCGGN